MKLKTKHQFLLSLLFAFVLAGCSSVPLATTPLPTGTGIYHRVEKKQTLWKISKMYGIELEELARINHISDATNIEVGQLIFIPNRNKLTADYSRYSSDEFIWPVRGKIMLAFGQVSNNMQNKGLNIQPYGNSDVVASRSGKVIFYSENFATYGKTLIIDHLDGFNTVYARNAQIFVKPGDSVQKGHIIAKAGNAGRDKNTYLHFEIRKGHAEQNPLFYLP